LGEGGDASVRTDTRKIKGEVRTRVMGRRNRSRGRGNRERAGGLAGKKKDETMGVLALQEVE